MFSDGGFEDYDVLERRESASAFSACDFDDFVRNGFFFFVCFGFGDRHFLGVYGKEAVCVHLDFVASAGGAFFDF